MKPVIVDMSFIYLSLFGMIAIVKLSHKLSYVC